MEESIFDKRLVLAKAENVHAIDRMLEPDQVLALDELQYTALLKQRGLEDCEDLITYGSNNQIRGAMDMDCWHGDLPDYKSLDSYFTMALSISPECLTRVIDLLDQEVLIAYLKEKMVVFPLEKDEMQPPATVDNGEEMPRYETPDGFFVVDLLHAPASDALNPLTVLDMIYREDLELGFRTVQAILWELQTEQEEMAYQFRCSRLEDLGFLPYEEAAKLYTPLPNDNPLPPPLRLEDPVTTPNVYLRQLPSGKPFCRVLQNITDSSLLDRLEQELIFITNTASVVEHVEPGDLDGMINLFIRIEGYLSLAIELFHGDDTIGAAERLKNCALTWYMRKGFGTTWKLAQRAAKIEGQYQLAQRTEELTDNDIALIKALKQRIPGYIPPEEFLEEMAKPFTSAQQVLEVQARLDTLQSKLEN